MAALRYVRVTVSGLALGGLMATVAAAPAVAAAPPPAVVVVPGVDITPPDAGYTLGWQVNNRGQVLLWSTSLIWQNGHYTDVGSLGGGTAGTTAINDAGDVVGDSSRSDGTDHAFRWRRGRMTDLGTLGGTSSTALAVAPNGDVAGRSFVPDGSEHAFLWRNGRMIDTGVPSGFDSQMYINARGQIATDHSIFGPTGRAYLWDHGVTTDLGNLGGGGAQVFGINDRGDIVGRSTTAAGDWHAFLWRHGRMTDLGTLGGPESKAVDINDRGQISGFADTADGPTHAFRWQNGVLTDLDAGSTGVMSYGGAINARGDVVGIRQDGNGNRAAVWRGHRVLVLDPIGAETSQGQDINDAGLAIGEISPNPFAPTRAAVWNTAGY